MDVDETDDLVSDINYSMLNVLLSNTTVTMTKNNLTSDDKFSKF